MAASGSITSASSVNYSLEGRLILTVNWTQVCTAGSDYSDVQISANITRENSGNAAGGTWFAWNDGSISVNGTAAITFYDKSTTGSWTTAGDVGWTGSGTVRVYHTAATSVSVSIDSVDWHNTTYSKFNFTIPAKTTTITLEAVPSVTPPTPSYSTYSLTISAGTGTTLVVDRIASPNAGAATGVLSNGAKIYTGDVLQFWGGPITGYDLSSFTVNGSSVANGKTHTVSSNVSVSTRATVKQFALTTNQGYGTTLSVTRTSSPKAGAGTGSLANGSTIYYGDVLSITASASDGFLVSILTVNGYPVSNGYLHSVASDVSVGSIAKWATVPCINNGSSTDKYLMCVWDGTGWVFRYPNITS